MASLFDIAKSGVQSYRQSLAVTGQNIANINTEGYRRREADLSEVTAGQGGITGVSSQAGLGVRVEGIRRSFDAYMLSRASSATADYEKISNYVKQLEVIENTLLPTGGGLGVQIGRFFDSLQQVAAAPGDLPPRLVAIEEGKGLASSFQTVSGQMASLKKASFDQAKDAVSAINLLLDQLANVNGRILSSGQGASAPNSALDLRDRLTSDLSMLMNITVDYTDRGVANVTVGSTGAGAPLVTAASRSLIGIIEQATGLQPTIISGANQTPTNQISSGALAGMVDAYTFIDEVVKDIDHLAVTISQEMNAQHQLGLNMEGLSGGNMFSATGLTAEAGAANRGSVLPEVTVSDPLLLPREDMTFVYRSDLSAWTVTNPNLDVKVQGSNKVVGSGFSLTFGGAPSDGDVVQVSALSGAASAMRFMLTRAQDIAAASATNVSQDTANTSDALITATQSQPVQYSTPPNVDKVFRNSDSPIVATQFLRDGVVAAIPAGAENVNISSFAQQSSVQFQISAAEYENTPQLQFDLNGVSYTFNLAFGSVYPAADSGATWQSLDDIGVALNRGTIRSTSATNEVSLSDIGIHVSAQGGNLTMTSAVNPFVSAQVTHAAGIVSGVVAPAIAASNIQVFTREGRHVAGTPLTQTEVAAFLMEKNGFAAGAEYRADYLNVTDNAYRGMDLDILRSDGMHRLTTGADAVSAQAIGGAGAIPVSGTNTYALSVSLANGRSAEITVPSGSSAEYAASVFNQGLSQLGVQAEAKTRVFLSNFNSTGTVKFNLESVNQQPIAIEANVASGQLASLVAAVNSASAMTGVSAVLTDDNMSLVLESKTGKDIMISDVDATGPSFSAEVLGLTGDSVSGQINFHAAGVSPAIDSGRFSGTIDIVSGEAFTLTKDSVTVTTSALDAHTGGLVGVSNNIDGTKKTLTFEVNPEADLNISDTDGLQSVAAAGSYRLDLTAGINRPEFNAVIATSRLSDLTPESVSAELVRQIRAQAPIASLMGDVAIDAQARPADGDSFRVSFSGVTYTVEMSGDELNVSGGEDGRLTAYFDASNKIQISSDGSLSANDITVEGDTANVEAALRFGLSSPISKITGRSFALPATATTASVTLNGVTGSLTVNADGTYATANLPANLTVNITVDGGTARAVFTFPEGAGPMSFGRDDDTVSLGLKTTDYNIVLKDGAIEITSLDSVPVAVSASAESLAKQRIRMSGMPNEDLIVIVSGGNARRISASYDIAPAVRITEQVEVRVVNDAGTQIEIFDAETGHSIATRSLDDLGNASAGGYDIHMDGKAERGDKFHVSENIGGVGDARNLLAILSLQRSDVDGAFSGGFQDVFAKMVTSVGSSLQSSNIALEGAEASRDAAVEAEMSFSGVNLDSEAAALLEYQQAYQASARVLSAARELFKTLIEIV